jgi:Initiator Replication protein
MVRRFGADLKQEDPVDLSDRLWALHGSVISRDDDFGLGSTVGQRSTARTEPKQFRLEELRWVFGLGSIKDADGNVIKEARLPVWANFQQRALDVAILEVNAKTDLKIKLASIERLKHRRVVALNFMIKTQPIPKVNAIEVSGPHRSAYATH